MADTHERIMQAAKDLFEIKGFAAVTTKEIADAAEVSEVTLFRHFESKRGLFEAIMHSCIHPYKIDEYLESEVKYDFDVDLKKMAYKMMEVYRQNAPTLRMILRDKERDSVHEMRFKKDEHSSRQKLMEYFETMRRLGKTSTEPKMAVVFYMSNIVGYLMREILSGRESDENYFAWMLDKVITCLKADTQGQNI